LINYQKYREEFDEFLDETGDISIGLNFSIAPSQVLYELDELAYNEQLIEYVDQKKSEHNQVIHQYYPAPIAYFYQQAEQSYDSEQNRLQLLRSTWESLIFVLFALIMGVVNSKRFSLKQIRVFQNEKIRGDHRGILSYRIGWKIEFMQRIIEYDQQNNIELIISSLIDVDLFETLKELNQERNSFSHIAAMNETEAKERFYELYPIVSDLLFELDFLENVSLLQYSRSLEDVNKIRFNKYAGHSLQGQNYDKNLSQRELSKYSSLLTNQVILIEFEDLLFNVSPFMHFYHDGHQLKLAYYKRINKRENCYEFEVVGIGLSERKFNINCAEPVNFINIPLGDLL